MFLFAPWRKRFTQQQKIENLENDLSDLRAIARKMEATLHEHELALNGDCESVEVLRQRGVIEKMKDFEGDSDLRWNVLQQLLTELGYEIVRQPARTELVKKKAEKKK